MSEGGYRKGVMMCVCSRGEKWLKRKAERQTMMNLGKSEEGRPRGTRNADVSWGETKKAGGGGEAGDGDT